MKPTHNELITFMVNRAYEYTWLRSDGLHEKIMRTIETGLHSGVMYRVRTSIYIKLEK